MTWRSSASRVRRRRASSVRRTRRRSRWPSHWEDTAIGETAYQVYRVLADGSLDLLATLPAGATTFSETVPNYTSYTYAVQAISAMGPLADPPTLGLLFRPALRLPPADHKWSIGFRVEVPNLTQTVDGPHRIGRIGFWDGEARLLRGDNSTGLYYITTALEDADPSVWTIPVSRCGPAWMPGSAGTNCFHNPSRTATERSTPTALTINTGATPNQRFMLCVAAYLAYGVWGSDMFRQLRCLLRHQRSHRQGRHPQRAQHHAVEKLRGAQLEPLPAIQPGTDGNARALRAGRRGAQQGAHGRRLGPGRGFRLLAQRSLVCFLHPRRRRHPAIRL